MEATAAFKHLADRNQISLVQLALAFVRAQGFVHSTIIGATKMAQLKENIESVKVSLSQEVLEEIEHIFDQYPDAGL